MTKSNKNTKTVTDTKTVATKTVTDKKTIAKERAKLLAQAKTLGVDISTLDTAKNDDIEQVIAQFKSLDSQPVKAKKVETKKPDIKNILGGSLVKSKCKSNMIIDITLTNGTIISQKLGKGSFYADKANEISLAKVIKDGDKLSKLIIKHNAQISDVLYNIDDNHLYFFTGGAYSKDGDSLLNDQVGYWLSNLSTIPDISLIASVAIKEI